MASKKPREGKNRSSKKRQNKGEESPETLAETTPKESATNPGHTYQQVEHRETFDYQPTSSKVLPDPRETVDLMVPQVLESVHGMRDPRQLSRWVSHPVYLAIQNRSISVRLKNATIKKPTARPVFALGNVVVSEPRDGVAEAAAVVHGPTRVRAVALRLEGLDNRWMMTSFRML